METTKTRWGKFYTHYHQKETEDFQAKLKTLYIDPLQNLSYQRHENREERWVVIKGTGTLVVDGVFTKMKKGEAFHIPLGAWHSVKAGEEGLVIAEIQYGKECVEEDITRMLMDWNEILWFIGGVSIWQNT
jgi:mannose-1-phosphate guanylyltransferase